MKKRFSFQRLTVMTYTVVLALFVAFAGYMLAFENNKVYRVRDTEACQTVENYSVTEIADPSAPAGVRMEYRWILQNNRKDDVSLAFYLIHSYAEVRFDDELMYSLTAGENNRIGMSPSSNWVIIPVYRSDYGRQVTVTVTPVYRSVVNRTPQFKIGSEYDIMMSQLKNDLPQIVLSFLCILMGILLIIVQLYLKMKKQIASLDLLYLGNFSLLIGVWRITDTRFSSVMFADYSMALGYIALAALFIMAVPFLLFMSDQNTGKKRVLLKTATLATCAVALVALCCQVFGLAELREMLIACHTILMIDIVVLVGTSLCCLGKGFKELNTFVFIVLLVTGSLTDLVNYYLQHTSSGMVVTLVAFVIYTTYYFIDSIMNINRKAYVDVATKLYNKTCWDIYIEEYIPANEPVGIMMMDINCLKHINDTLGHKTGDKVIVRFAEILRNTFEPGEFLCRWGGDEFTVLVRNATHEKMGNYISALRTAVEAYNRSGETPEISFACGYVLSSDDPTLSKKELFAKADEWMYADKQPRYTRQTAVQ